MSSHRNAHDGDRDGDRDDGDSDPHDKLALKNLSALVASEQNSSQKSRNQEDDDASTSSMSPFSFQHYNYLAAESLETGYCEKAIAYCDKSLQQLENTRAYCLKAKSLGRLHRVDEGLRVIAKSVDLNGSDQESLTVESDLVLMKSEQDRVEGGSWFVAAQYSSCQGVWDAQPTGAAVGDRGSGSESGSGRRDCVHLCRELSHDESMHHSTEEEVPGDADAAEETLMTRRGADKLVEETFPTSLVDDDGVLVDSLGIQFGKLTTTPLALEKTEDSHTAVAHMYTHSLHDLVRTFGLPTREENNLSGVVTGPMNKHGRYPVFVQFPRHTNAPSVTRYYLPENLWSSTRAVKRRSRTDDSDKKFRVKAGTHLHHQYHYQSRPATSACTRVHNPPSTGSYNLKEGTDDVDDGVREQTHDEIRRAVDELKITQKTLIHAPEKYDNPVPKIKQYAITFLKVVDTLDA